MTVVRVRTLCVLGSAVAVLAACSSSNGGEGSSEPTSSGGEVDATDGANAFEEGDEISIRYATWQTEDDVFAYGPAWMMDEIESRTDGRVSFEPFFAGSLLAPEETLPGILDGRVDAGMVADAYVPDMPMFRVALPFVSSNGEAVGRALHDVYESNEAFRTEWDEAGLKPLLFAVTGTAFAGLAEPAESLDDLQGRRIRALGYIGDVFTSLDIEPVFLSLAEVYEAVDRGVVDGFSGAPFASSVRIGLHEPAPHFVDIGLGVSSTVANFTMSMDSWEALPADVQRIFREVATEAYDVAVDYHTQVDREACERFTDEAVSVTVLDDPALQSWQDSTFEDVVKPAWLADVSSAGHDEATAETLLDEFTDAVRTREAETEYVDGLQACAR